MLYEHLAAPDEHYIEGFWYGAERSVHLLHPADDDIHDAEHDAPGSHRLHSLGSGARLRYTSRQ